MKEENERIFKQALETIMQEAIGRVDKKYYDSLVEKITENEKTMTDVMQIMLDEKDDAFTKYVQITSIIYKDYIK